MTPFNGAGNGWLIWLAILAAIIILTGLLQ